MSCECRSYFPITELYLENLRETCMYTLPVEERSCCSCKGRWRCVWFHEEEKFAGILPGLSITFLLPCVALYSGVVNKANHTWGGSRVARFADTVLGIPTGFVAGVTVTALGVLGAVFHPAIAFREEAHAYEQV